MAADDPGLLATEAAGPMALVAPDLSAGDAIGRFQVVETLGRGGMSIVVSANDPRLDRRVAIKLVGPSGDATDQNEFRARLQREARAMAQLRHPNVVAIYEVGEHRGHVYLAMEQMTGGTLRGAVARMRASGADWRAIVGLYAQAARGLGAAHQAGMVHRDFKPDNVLVDGDGRVAVGDFGLVGDSGGMAGRIARGDSPIGDNLTRDSIVVGTPAYMAPEQQTGGTIDARADQFAFCVSLYEALYGQMPFEGETRNEYLDAALAGAVRPPPAEARVPAWLRSVLARGLSTDPARRWPSMDALLTQLGGDPAAERGVSHVERAIGVALAGTFLCGVLLSALLFDLEMSYRLHYLTDLGFIALASVVGWLSRDAVMRTAFNRRLFSLAATASVLVLAMTAGGHLLGLSATATGILHLFVIGACALIGAISERRLAVLAGNYLAAFFVTAAWPAVFVPVSLVAHALLAILTIAIYRPSKQASKPR
jgi:hypothetical protein